MVAAYQYQAEKLIYVKVTYMKIMVIFNRAYLVVSVVIFDTIAVK